MRILLDLQVLQAASSLRGIGRYSRGLADALLHNLGDNASALLNLSLGDDENFNDLRRWSLDRLPRPAIHTYSGMRRTAGRNPANEANRRAGALCYDAYVATLGVDIVHIASPFEGYTDDVVAGWGEKSGPARASTVYDLIPFQQPDVHLNNPIRLRWYNERLNELLRADVLLTISEATRGVILNLLEFPSDRVVNIGADCGPEFKKVVLSPDQKNVLLSRYKLSKPFIIHVGPAEPRKNVGTLIQAYGELSPQLRAGHQLLLVGEMTEAQRQEVTALARKARIDPADVTVPGFVPDTDLICLYGLAQVAVMPSRLEGFGLPLLEAMRCGSPVLGANCSSLPEVIGSEDLLFDPDDAGDLAGKLTLILTDKAFRDCALAHCERQQTRFSWQRSAAIAKEAFSETVARRKAEHRVPHGGKRRYVLVPRRDMAADPLLYVAAGELAGSGDVAVALAPGSQDFPARPDSVKLIDPEAVEAAGDQRVVVVGSPAGLDEDQRAVLKKVPAVLLKSPLVPQFAPAAEVIYRLGGYAALQRRRPDGAGYNACDYPNVMAALTDAAGLPERIESAFRSHPLGIALTLLDRLRMLEGYDAAAVATIVAENHSVSSAPRLLLDLATLVHHDAGTGIQRVVKSVLASAVAQASEWRIEPIYFDGHTYRYARKFSASFLKVDVGELTDAQVDFRPSDIFLGLNLDIQLRESAVAILKRHQRRGMRLVFVVYDLLPMRRSDWFHPNTAAMMTSWINKVSNIADHLVAISQSVANDVNEFLNSRDILVSRRPAVSWWHLGADFMAAGAAPQALPALNVQDDEIVNRLEGRVVFLTVGTIEPRKGISQLIDAATDFWRTNDATFVVVGKKGWFVDDLIARIKAHPEFGRRLLWIDRASDSLLDRLYGVATAALLPSEGEGFGLPLIEAGNHNKPIIARDLLVFREICGASAFYFSADTGKELAAALREWMELHQRDEVSKPAFKVATWNEATNKLFGIVKNAAAQNHP